MKTLIWYNKTKEKFEFGDKKKYFQQKNNHQVLFQYMLLRETVKDRASVLVEELEEGKVPL